MFLRKIQKLLFRTAVIVTVPVVLIVIALVWILAQGNGEA